MFGKKSNLICLISRNMQLSQILTLLCLYLLHPPLLLSIGHVSPLHPVHSSEGEWHLKPTAASSRLTAGSYPKHTLACLRLYMTVYWLTLHVSLYLSLCLSLSFYYYKALLKKMFKLFSWLEKKTDGVLK